MLELERDKSYSMFSTTGDDELYDIVVNDKTMKFAVTERSGNVVAGVFKHQLVWGVITKRNLGYTTKLRLEVSETATLPFTSHRRIELPDGNREVVIVHYLYNEEIVEYPEAYQLILAQMLQMGLVEPNEVTVLTSNRCIEGGDLDINVGFVVELPNQCADHPCTEEAKLVDFDYKVILALATMKPRDREEVLVTSNHFNQWLQPVGTTV